MVTSEEINRINKWFDSYTAAFGSKDPEMQGAVDIKREHTQRVCEAAEKLAQSLGMEDGQVRAAMLCALLHDVGRFEQYRKYRTFSDANSENHALLGLKVIRQSGILSDMDKKTAAIIMRSVECHNRMCLPENEAQNVLKYIKITRDADKIDIWRVVTRHYAQAPNDKNRSVSMGLPDLPGVSQAVAGALLEGRLARMSDLRTLTDFKLLQMGWIYDLNFTLSFKMVQERQYLEKIRASMPKDSIQIETVYQSALAFLRRRCP